MLPTTRDSLHVRSRRLLVGGGVRPGIVELALGPRGAVVVDVRPDADEADAIDVGDALVAPAPLDLHFHGCGGHVVPPGGDPGAIDLALRDASRDAGWSHELAVPAYEWIATLPVPQRPPADPVEHLAAAAQAVAAQPDAWCVGLRIEGLFLNPLRAGVWPPETFRPPDTALLEELHAAAREAGGALRIIDVAPELPGAVELVERARELGIVASLAHSDATWEQARRAIDAGATLATHTWNAMRPVTHRDPGIVAAVLADPRVHCELICDGVHLHPGTIALSVAACGAGGWVAISDASPFAGCPPGPYRWAGTTVTHDGVALRDPEGHLAGSASLLDVAPGVLRGIGLDDVAVAVAMGAAPRRVLDPSRALGLQVGDPAWIVELH
ncbi:MAG: nagA [Thermoleophilia bacterium]|nr:nagA [Thermoleophilia bacterium]